MKRPINEGERADLHPPILQLLLITPLFKTIPPMKPQFYG